jgi:hypothetical protein
MIAGAIAPLGMVVACGEAVQMELTDKNPNGLTIVSQHRLQSTEQNALRYEYELGLYKKCCLS